ncbi:hypothetical protein [Helicobacter rodentium]|nr:hypothetical protein [Helicobacter rodentium]
MFLLITKQKNQNCESKNPPSCHCKRFLESLGAQSIRILPILANL